MRYINMLFDVWNASCDSYSNASNTDRICVRLIECMLLTFCICNWKQVYHMKAVRPSNWCKRYNRSSSFSTNQIPKTQLQYYFLTKQRYSHEPTRGDPVVWMMTGMPRVDREAANSNPANVAIAPPREWPTTTMLLQPSPSAEVTSFTASARIVAQMSKKPTFTFAPENYKKNCCCCCSYGWPISRTKGQILISCLTH